ncbi:MAG: Ig-like domain-containing protein, partial [Pseudomonadota bacterium]|nr:Ig-like domain-containing protein [Pseudomonadota bacterium]
ISSVTAGWGTYLNATEDNSDGTVTVVTSGAENGQRVTVALNGTNYFDNVSNNSTAVTFAASGLQALTDGDNYTLTTNVSDAAGNAATVNTGTSFTYDITTPMISGGVAITSATGIQNNLLNAGDNVSVTATFSENSPVTGTPQLTLAVGDDNQTATYASSGNGGTTLVFKYTIQAGDNDTNGISIRANALALDNGTISDLAGNNAILTHSPVDNNSSYMVDTEAPRVDNFTLSDTALKAGDNATVTLEFSEAVASFSSADDITVDNGTLATMTSSDNITWTGTFTPLANTEEDNTTLSLGTSYTDLAGNAGPAATTANYAIDTLLPTISSVTAGWGTFLNATEDNSPGTVTVLTSGAENDQTVTVALNGTNYTGTVSDNSTSVTFAATGLQALTDGSSYTLTTNVSDAAGNAATVNTDTSFTYDITAPTISGGVTITSATGIQNNFLNAGDVVSVTATFSEVVNITGTPQLTLAVGSTNRTATYASGSSSTSLVFQYTIQAGDNDTDG